MFYLLGHEGNYDYRYRKTLVGHEQTRPYMCRRWGLFTARLTTWCYETPDEILHDEISKLSNVMRSLWRASPKHYIL